MHKGRRFQKALTTGGGILGATVEVATTSTLNKVHGKVADKKLNDI